MRRLAELDEKLAASSAELRQYAASDPERYEALSERMAWCLAETQEGGAMAAMHCALLLPYAHQLPGVQAWVIDPVHQ